MEHNLVTVSVDAAMANALMATPSGNPSSKRKKAEGRTETAYDSMLARYKKLDRMEIPIHIEKWTTWQGHTAYVVYNTMNQSIFITSVEPVMS